MATNKRITDLTDYTSVLPYASEIFGVYQPLLGWKSKRIQERFMKGFLNDRNKILDTMAGKFTGNVKMDLSQIENCRINILDIKPGVLSNGVKKKLDSILLDTISQRLPLFEEYNDEIWETHINEDHINIALREFVVHHYQSAYINICENFGRLADIPGADKASLQNSLVSQLNYESSLGGMLLQLKSQKNFIALKEIFYTTKDNSKLMNELSFLANSLDPKDAFLNLENIDPRNLEHLKSVGLSPISVVHLFRQYFFEFDTFLGSPVGHIWLSPDSTVELIEISTRKTITERAQEQSLENIFKTEESITNKDEISESVKEDNKNETKFGANASGHQGWIGGEANASASLDFNTTQQKAREISYKQMREQTKKLSSEIRQNFKSSFKTITETTDSSSKRYVLSNKTNDLVNYELRRKMRQVGVQVQDIGTYLCWQTYVDDPGASLGLGELVHIAQETDVEGKPKHPAEAVMPDDVYKDHPISIPFIGREGDNDDKGELYINGKESNGDDLHIITDFEQSFSCDKPHYILDGNNIVISAIDEVEASVINVNAMEGKFTIRLNRVHFHDQPAVKVNVKLKWVPNPIAYQKVYEAAMKQYETDIKEYNAKVERVAKQDFINAAKERIKLASKINSRKYEDLREEERIVVYRKLIQEMLTKGMAIPDDTTRHVVAELINSIFDVDKMLYFVAPEWWRPRLHQSHQSLGQYKKPSASYNNSNAPIDNESFKSISALPHFANNLINGSDAKRSTPLKDHAIGWGGIKGQREDNYYITEDSDRAKLGSSLGWLLQLDGDNLRNAFLNAPWVKAVIPIRPGKEEAALNWLQKVEGTNGISDEFVYHTDNVDEKSIDGIPLNGMPMMDVLKDLAKKINRKHQEAYESGKYPKQDPADPEPVDPGNTVTSTPVDRVYEHGFYPLVGGFRNKVAEDDPNFKTIAQWIEILPTDQVVAVAVEYDPKTGRQK